MAINTLETTSHVALARTNYISISLKPNARSTNKHSKMKRHAKINVQYAKRE